jgi:phosphatidylserine decarboxylase
MPMTPDHQYVDRATGAVITERLYADPLLRWIYAAPWEGHDWLVRTLTSAHASRVLSFLNYDLPFGSATWGAPRIARSLGIDLHECVEPPEKLDTARKLFQRTIRYWDVRPMDDDPQAIVAPADARILVGSFAEQSALFVKGKFFEFEELFGLDRGAWIDAFRNGDFIICRLTPDKYHYNHLPVSGTVREIYTVSGQYHSCNPGSVVSITTPYSKNARVMTILDTDVPGGTGIGLVAMIEVVELMIGAIDQCYSEMRYARPSPVVEGMFLRKGQPKSLYRPGSSTTVVVFQAGRIEFSPDLVRNLSRSGVHSRFSQGFGTPLVETDVRVRSTVGMAIPAATHATARERDAYGQ